MSDYDQQPFLSEAFADNPEMRCPCVLLLDTSGSMGGQPIDELNQGLMTFKKELMADSLAAKRVQVAVVTFGNGVNVESEFMDAMFFEPPVLSASGITPMGEAIETALSMVEQQKQIYNDNAISYYRPWIFMITDGAPTDNWEQAAVCVKEAEKRKKVTFVSVGVKGADFQTLREISPRQPYQLQGLEFSALFQWLSNSLGIISASQKGQVIDLPVADCLKIEA